MLRSPLQAAAEPCRASAIVLDFDGTLTDADADPARPPASETALGGSNS